MKTRGAIFVLTLVLFAGLVFAQRRGRPDDFSNPRAYQHSGETPMWTNPPGFEKDVFTFVRIIYGSAGNSRRGFGGRQWLTDWPDDEEAVWERFQRLRVAYLARHATP